MSMKSRIKTLEKARGENRSVKMDLEQAIKRFHLEGIYEPRWIREQYGIEDPASEEIDRKFERKVGAVDESSTTMGRESERER
jgi:hypothetical protein